MQSRKDFVAAVAARLASAGFRSLPEERLSTMVDTDLLFYRLGGKGVKAKRPVALCIVMVDEPTERIDRFVAARAAVTRYGEVLRIAMAVDDASEAEEVARQIGAFLAAEDTKSVPALTRIARLRGEWVSLDPETVTPETPPPLPERSAPPKDPPPQRKERARRERSSPLQREHDRRAALATGSASGASIERCTTGHQLEDEVAGVLVSFGCALTRNAFLDEGCKVDQLITGCDGMPPFRRPFAVQLTLRWDDLFKIEQFHAGGWRLRKKAGIDAGRLYVQIARGVTPAQVAAVILGQCVASYAVSGDDAARFVEIDAAGARMFDASARMRQLRAKADPVLTADQRRFGRITVVNQNVVLIVSDDRRRYRGYMSEIADRELQREVAAIKEQNSGALHGRRVSFIPDRPRGGKGASGTATSILPASASET